MSNCLLFNSCVYHLWCLLYCHKWSAINKKSCCLGERSEAVGAGWEMRSPVLQNSFGGMSLKSVSLHLSLPQDTPVQNKHITAEP